MMTGARASRRPYTWFSSVPLCLLFRFISCNYDYNYGGCVYPEPPGDCPTPPVPKNGAFTCSFGCWRDGTKFLSGSKVEYYCDGGYSLNTLVTSAWCREGEWTPTEDIVCRPSQGYGDAHAPAALPGPSISLVAAVAATVSGFLLMAMVCVLVKPKSLSFQCCRYYNRMQEPDLLTEDWCPVPLPSYEEAVYGPYGRHLLPTSLQAPLPLILAEGDLVQQDNSAERLSNTTIQITRAVTPPPSYEEVLAAAWETDTCAGPEMIQSSHVPSFLEVPMGK